MVMQITVNVPDAVYQRAKRLAKLIEADVETVVSMMLELSLPRFEPDVDISIPVEDLSDNQVMLATDLQLIPEQSERHSHLLKQQQNNGLNDTEQAELNTLNRVYELGLIYQSQAFAEATKRGLIPGMIDESVNQ